MKDVAVLRCCECGKHLYKGDKAYLLKQNENGLTVNTPFCSDKCFGKYRYKKVLKLQEMVASLVEQSPEEYEV